VLDTVCSAVELPAPAAGSALAGLRSFTRDRRMLLVLDNCEHVLDAAAELVDELLTGGPELAVLATSREPLEVAGEQVRPLAPLAPAPAVELFLERLDLLTGPGSDRTADETKVAGEIAAAVDGLPLALELAAGRARAYSLSEIALQVRADASSLSRVGRVRAAHHHTIRGAIDSSYRALPEPEAVLHRAVGVVPGPFTADLAAALVGRDPSDTVDTIAGLVHRSLLTSLARSAPTASRGSPSWPPCGATPCIRPSPVLRRPATPGSSASSTTAQASGRPAPRSGTGRWKTTSPPSLVDAASAALGRAGLEQARADAVRLTLADLVDAG
jgi:predicted ATPase